MARARLHYQIPNSFPFRLRENIIVQTLDVLAGRG